MKKKLLLLFAVIFGLISTAQSQTLSWMGNSYFFIGDAPNNSTWYNGSGASPQAGGAFHNKDFGTVSSLKIGGEAQNWDRPYGVTAWFNYQIDDGAWQSVEMSWIRQEGNNDLWQTLTGTEIIDGSLLPGNHTISVYFSAKFGGTTVYDSNGGSNYTASFTVASPTTITLNVTVPPGTETCYVAGTMNGWSHEPMDKVDATHYTSSFAVNSGEVEYKYCSGPGWQYEELQANGEGMENRILVVTNSPSDDEVALWKEIYVPKFIEFTNPATPVYVAEQNASVNFSASALQSATLNLYISEKDSGAETLLTTTTGTSISYLYNFSAPSSYWAIAEATTPEIIRDSLFVVVKKDIENEARPSLPDGINIIDDNTVIFILYAPDKNNVFVVGDFNEWLPENDYLMKKDNDYWWLSIDNLQPNIEYAFQYLVDGNLYVGDAYAQKILDPWNDKYISSTTYPNLKPYPEGKNANDGPVSVFQTNETPYNWEVTNFQSPRQDKLVIYELLIRDFTSEGDLIGVLSKLDYLKELGINAIELMPTQEFDGNDSWGYNPCFYFAMDKAYGTKEMYQQFIDECHKQGIAVILDVVYNHATGQHPFAKLYWDAGVNKTASDNPWFNVDAPHPHSVFHDFNHESPLVREFFKRNLTFLLEEYKFDGFRFDLTKGLSQRNVGEDDAWASSYDQSRIDILEDYKSHIESVKTNAYMIIEHFCEDAEERVLGDKDNGMMPWGRVNDEYLEAAMAYVADFNGVNGWTRSNPWFFDNIVGFMESHDEERLMYKAKMWGATNDIKNDLSVQMERAALNAAFFLPVPGAKMIWQFGELGYDISIDENGRTGRKPILWNYYDIPERKMLYDTYSKLIKLREYYGDAFDNQSWWNEQIGSGNWENGKRICLNSPDLKMVIIGNFKPTGTAITDPDFPATGIWYDLITGETMDVTDTNMTISLEPGKFKVLTDKEIFTTQQIIWTGTADNNDWDDPANWNDGRKRNAASIVTIPGDAPNFPILTKDVTVAEIRFEPGAQIGNQSKLTGKAFVQYDLRERNRWHMLSMPLGQAYPADFSFGGFPLTWVRTFTAAPEGSLSKGIWVTARGVKDRFTFGDAFIVWLNDDDPAINKGLKQLNGIRELPYFENHAAESLTRDMYEIINPAHDYDSGTGMSTFYNFDTNDNNKRIISEYYEVVRNDSAYLLLKDGIFTKDQLIFYDGFALIGNPYLAVLDFDEFSQENSSDITPNYHVWVNEGNVSGYSTYTPDGFVGIVESDKFIAPLQGFIVEKPVESPVESFSLVFNEESMTTVNKDIKLRSSLRNENKIDIVACNPIADVRTFIAKRDKGQTEFGNSDARKIINAISDVPEIYTLKPYKGRSIAAAANIINNDDLLIPVGLATSYTGEITLSFSGMDSYDAKIYLFDAGLMRSIDLTGLNSYNYTFNYKPAKINGEPAVCENRFFIRISKSATGLEETIAERVNVFESNGLILIFSGASNPIKEVAMFDLQGSLIYKATDVAAISHTIERNLPAGAYIVKVVSEKNTDNVKLIKR